MLVNHVVLLLLSWQCVKAIEDEKPPPVDVFDQVATASENRASFDHGQNDGELPQDTLKISTTTSTPNTVTIHYENSNGFVPMTSRSETDANDSLIADLEKSAESIEIPSEIESIENDPVYSTEARMIMNLAGPGADRRSFDTQETEFEILKVNDETPAIANYHEFYENVRNNLNLNRAASQNTQDRYSPEGRDSNKRTKERIKQIDKYLTNYQGGNEQYSVNQYYNNYSGGNTRPNTRQKETFEPSKVPMSFEEQSYDRGTFNPRSQYSNTNNRYTKPVVVIEPNDFKLDLKHGSQQGQGKVGSTDKDQEHRTPELDRQYEGETRLNREDRYGVSHERSEDSRDYSTEDDYLEITEKPRRMHSKTRRRPHAAESSRRLPKEHRGAETETDDSRRSNSYSRSKLHRARAKPSYWIEDDRVSEETSDERPSATTTRSSEKRPKQSSKPKSVNSWNQVGPNIEVSHSNGFEIGQIDKPKLLVPVNLNLVPLTNFDHTAAIGNSQGFDFTNVPNFVTATPIVSTQPTHLSTSHSLIASGQTNPTNSAKNVHHAMNNYGPTPVPDVIVGQNTYQNPVQAVLLPHFNINGKFSTNPRPQYASSTVAPMLTVTSALNHNLPPIMPTMTGMQMPTYQSTPRSVNSANQNGHQATASPSVNPAVPQFFIPQPTMQTFPLLHSPYNTNIFVNPNGLHGQNVIQPGYPSGPSAAGLNVPSSTSPPQLQQSSNNYHDNQLRKNNGANSNGQFVTTASLAVGNTGQSNIANDQKYYLSTNNQNLPNNNNQFYSLTQNVEQSARPQQQTNFYQLYRDDQNPNGKIKTYVQTAQVIPAVIHQTNSMPMNLHHQNYGTVTGHLQEQQSVLSPNVVLQRPRDQNQQILNAANDIFENTWKQLQQLRSNEDAAARRPYQHVYGVNDSQGSTSNTNGNAINALSVNNMNPAKAHLPTLSTQNVEIVNPNIKPSPVDLTIVNPYATMHHYPAAVLTTPIPIFSTTANFLAARPIVASTTPTPIISLQSYMDHLSQMGGQNNRANKIEQRPTSSNQDHQRDLFNPINFVPSNDLMKSQSILNSKNAENLPNQLNLVPLVPGGNFFKNSKGAQSELMQKPRLSSDLEKYADEMFKESLKTIYSTHKWNNDGRLRSNWSTPDPSDLANLRSELQRFKASMPDPKYSSKDILEAHHSETNVRTTESPSRPVKKPELSIADIEQLFKSDHKLSSSLETSHHGSHHKTRHPQAQHSSSGRPSSSNDHSNDFRNYKHLSDYLTPPRYNSFPSKNPFIEPPKLGKKRPGTTSSKYNSPNSRPPLRSGSRPSSNPEASSSNHVESGVRHDSHNRYEKYRSYPSFTTASSTDNGLFKTSSGEAFSKNDYYDINHPRMHNLLGLLMKNKQLPRGSAQSYFRDEEDLRQYFDNERRRVHTEFHERAIDNNSNDPINMGPPGPPSPKIQYYPNRGMA